MRKLEGTENGSFSGIGQFLYSSVMNIAIMIEGAYNSCWNLAQQGMIQCDNIIPDCIDQHGDLERT
jgi:hypothetical protein